MDVPHDWSVELTPVHSAGVNDPALWSVDTPTLYHVRTDIVSDDSVVDITTTGFGFRYTTFDPDSGFSLNGQYMKIMGVDLHATNGPLGAAVHYDALELQMQQMKSMGVNALRTAHNPPAPELVQVCERLGILMMVEAFALAYRQGPLRLRSRRRRSQAGACTRIPSSSTRAKTTRRESAPRPPTTTISPRGR